MLEELEYYERFPPEVIEKTVKCISCGIPLILVFDPSIRDTCDSCGGSAKVQYSLKEGNKDE